MSPVTHYHNLHIYTHVSVQMCCKIKILSICSKIVQFFVSFYVYLRKIKCEKEMKVIVNLLGLHGWIKINLVTNVIVAKPS